MALQTNVNISQNSDVILHKMFNQLQEDESTESKYDQIHEYSVIDKSKVDHKTSEYSVLDMSKKVEESVGSLEVKSKKMYSDEHFITKKKKDTLLCSKLATNRESTFSKLENELLRVETDQQMKKNQNEDKSMPYFKRNLCTIHNKLYLVFFVVIVMLVVVLAFIILAYSSILQLKPMQEVCSNTTFHLEQLFTTPLNSLCLSPSSSSVNANILEKIIHQYLNISQLNEICTPTCTTTVVQSTTTMSITSAPAASISSITTQSVTMTPSTSMYCRDNYSDIINSNTWRIVADLNMTIPNTQCPSNLTMYNTSGLRTCRRINYDHSCTSVYFYINSTYSKIFGGIRAYQYMKTNSFHQLFRRGNGTIDDPYVDGVSLTYGSPRQHIWTFASDRSQTNSHCPCGNLQSRTPDFVGGDYFCDSGVQEDSSNFTLAFNNPLWDGRGCHEGYNCCQYNNPPWFCKQLSNSTSQPIEMRVCSDQTIGSEDIAIETIHLFVHE